MALAREVAEETGLRVTRVEKFLWYFDYRSGSGKRTRQFNFLVEAFEMVARGSSLWNILAHVTRLGLTSINGKPLSLSTLQHLLRNPIYCGMVRYRDELFEGGHEPLVNKTLFSRAQKNLKKRQC